MSDLSFCCDGSVTTVTVQSTAGMEWVDEHVQTESWQWLGERTFGVESRYAPDLLTAAQLDGLECDT